MTFRLIADSSANLHNLESVDFASVPLKIITATEEFVDDTKLDVSTMVETLRLAKGKTGTSCPNMTDWLDAFAGADRIIAITITSNLSGACASCTQAAREYEQEHPGAKVFVIDSLSTGPEMALILEQIAQWHKEGMEFDALCQKATDYTAHTHLSFCLESLANLARNGRVNPAVAKIAGVLGIRLVGVASAEGTLEPLHKPRGEKKALEAIYEDMLQRGYRGGKVRLAHCFNPDAAKALAERIRRDYPHAPIHIEACTGLCSFYAELGGLLVGYEDL